MLKWSDRFSVNHTVIDTQHRELFRLVGVVETLHLHKSNKSELAQLIKDLFNYMREHFKEEEAYMQSFGYPFLYGHQRLHQQIAEDITKMIKETKKIDELQVKIKNYMNIWLEEHILKHDLKYEKWRKENSGQVKEEVVNNGEFAPLKD